jgi:hypothetical protein
VSLVPANTDTAVATNDRYLVTIAAVLIALQVLDGILTLSGTLTFGLTAEGNPILRELMHLIGLVPALIVTKLGCISLVVALCYQATRISWLPPALTAVAGVYTVAAILPWSIILVSEYLG